MFWSRFEKFLLGADNLALFWPDNPAYDFFSSFLTTFGLCSSAMYIPLVYILDTCVHPHHHAPSSSLHRCRTGQEESLMRGE
jgi:hypothetical protein